MDSIFTKPATTQNRRPATFTIRPELIEQAKALKLNASRAAEAGLEAAIRDAKGKAWLAEHVDAIRAHNERVVASGVLITPIWLRD